MKSVNVDKSQKTQVTGCKAVLNLAYVCALTPKCDYKAAQSQHFFMPML